MKLSLKMFFGICIPAVISCLVIAAFLIEKNLDENIDAETQIAIKNVEKIENRIKYNEIVQFYLRQQKNLTQRKM